MKLYDLDSVVTFGKHKGETVAEILENNDTYIYWCYETMDDFYITDAVWEAMDIHSHLDDALKSGGVNPNEVRKAIATIKNCMKKREIATKAK